MTRRPHNPRPQHSRPRPRPAAPNARPGMTFLEAVLGVLLLGLITVTLTQVASAHALSKQRNNDRLACAELANRLVLQYLDDRDAMPSKTLPIAYGPSQRNYRWDIQTTDVDARVDEASARSGVDLSTVEKSLSRFQMLTVTVWLGEEHGGAYRYNPDIPSAAISRIHDPLLPSNPDSLQNAMQQPEFFERLVENMAALGQGQDLETTGNTNDDN